MYLLIVHHEVQWNQASLKTFCSRRWKLLLNPARCCSCSITSCPTHHGGIDCGKSRLDKDSKRLKGRNMRHEKHPSPWTEAWSEHGSRCTHWQMPQWQPWDVQTNLSFLRGSCFICSSRIVRSSSDAPYQRKTACLPSCLPCTSWSCLMESHQTARFEERLGLFHFSSCFIDCPSLHSSGPSRHVRSSLCCFSWAVDGEGCADQVLGTWVLLTAACVSAHSSWP